MHEDPEHITYFRAYRSEWKVLYMEKFFFSFRLSIDWCVRYKNNQTLDALIKYVALYNILYSDQLEIRLSVFTLTYQYVCFVQTFTSLSPIYQSFCSNHYGLYIFQRRVLTLDPP